jgi:hypothetical protein
MQHNRSTSIKQAICTKENLPAVIGISECVHICRKDNLECYFGKKIPHLLLHGILHQLESRLALVLKHATKVRQKLHTIKQCMVPLDKG